MSKVRGNAAPSQDKRLLESFSSGFANERDLIRAIAELLRKMGREGVEVLHGPQEYGKDIVFHSQGGFGERRLYACVIKNHKLSGNMDSDGGTRTVFLQAETAFDTPYTNSKGVDERVESVYIITPHECSQAAMFAIREKLKARSGQITFIAGSALLDLFLEFWKDFILFDSGALTKYLSGLPAKFATDTAFAALIRRYSLLSDVAKPLTQVYVQRDFREVLLAYSIHKQNKLPTFNLSRPIAKSDLCRFASALAETLGPVKKALESIGISSEALVSATDEVTHAFEQRWQALYRNGYLPELQKKRDDFIERRRAAHKKRASKANVPPAPFLPPSDDELRKEGLADVPEDEVRLHLSESPLLIQRIHDAEQLFDAAIGSIKSILETADSFVNSQCLDSPANAIPANSLYRKAQSLAFTAPSLVDSRVTAREAFFEQGLPTAGPRAMLITGPAGFGKTSFCKWHTLQDAQAYLDGTDRVLPIYVPVHQLHPREDDKFEDALILRDDLRELSANQADQPNLRIRLYLDGLDEVPDQLRQRLIMRLARMGLIENENLRIVATAREHVQGDWLGWLARVKITNLSEAQIAELVSNWLDRDSGRIKTFFDQLKMLPNLKQLMAVPLLGTLIIAVYRRTGAVPESRVELYELFVELHCGGWDLVKNVHRGSKYGSKDKELILERFAARLHYAESRDGEPHDFFECVKETLPRFAKEWQILLADILEDGLLSGVGDRLMFSHLSFQEFLTARYLAEPEGHRANSVLTAYFRGDEWWKEVLSFYVGLYSRPRVMLAWLDKFRKRVCVKAGRSEQSDIENRFRYLAASIHSRHPASVDDKRASA